jgi:hypothetical protein
MVPRRVVRCIVWIMLIATALGLLSQAAGLFADIMSKL